MRSSIAVTCLGLLLAMGLLFVAQDTLRAQNYDAPGRYQMAVQSFPADGGSSGNIVIYMLNTSSGEMWHRSVHRYPGRDIPVQSGYWHKLGRGPE